MLTAAKLLGEIGDITRFHSSAAFARHNGTAPIPVWSGNDDRHRLNRGGNRQLNTTLHRIAITQARCHEGARALLKRRQETTRDTGKGSFRVLKRHLSDVVYRALIDDHDQSATTGRPAHRGPATSQGPGCQQYSSTSSSACVEIKNCSTRRSRCQPSS
ncbi:transposase [Sphaerisporangium perillae]|uniref:transposase n=1 Tax=Sphaerisporangium perillae TaxID=2935860 RepID=UPI003557EE3A